MRLKCLLVLCLFCLSHVSSGQSVRCLLLDCNSQMHVADGNVICTSNGKGIISNSKGFFNLSGSEDDTLFIQVSCIGYKSISTFVVVNADSIAQVCLEPEIQNIEEVSVVADVKRDVVTTSTISAEALTHLQPSSFADVLELLPGGLTSNPNLTTMQLIALREPAGASRFSNNNYDYNSSFGTAFIVDNQVLSSDAQMNKVSGYLSGSELAMDKTNTTGKGMDMRMLPTDDIESVEIVRGIPSVKYGELTSGLVRIKRSYKQSPLNARFKANPISKLFAIGKGIQLREHRSINMNLDYLDYKFDPRDPKKNYGRMTGSLRFGDKISTQAHLISIKANADYTGSFDEKRIDQEVDHPETDSYEDNYNKIRFGGEVDFTSLKSSFFSSMDMGFATSYTHAQKIISRGVSGKQGPVTTNRQQGEYYSSFLPGSYVASYLNDDKPFDAMVYLNSYFNASLLAFNHQILMGGDWRYDKNFGGGEIYDETRPLYPGSGRPRAYKDVPAIEKLAFYLEDNITGLIGGGKLQIQAGLRAAVALNMDNNYVLSNKLYYDPRVNASFTFPAKEVLGKKMVVAIKGGYGWQTKFPGLVHFYPQLIYEDAVQLNYYSQNEALRQVQYKTQIIDPTNYNIKPNRSSKIELGFNVTLAQVKLDVVAYHEELRNGFKSLNRFTTMHSKRYDINSGPTPGELTAPPTVDMFDYEERRYFITYSEQGNGAREQKWGIEYQLDLGRVEALKSRITVNGAYMKSNFDLSEGRYDLPSTMINDEDYPYIGYYLWDRGKEYEQFNTNLRFDTQIKELGLIFSSVIENVWFTGIKYNYNSGMPAYYMDINETKYTYTGQDTEDSILRFLYKKYSSDSFNNRRIPFESSLNLKVTKQIGKKMRLAFYVNSLMYVAPDYKDDYGTSINRRTNPYFGMEININI